MDLVFEGRFKIPTTWPSGQPVFTLLEYHGTIGQPDFLPTVIGVFLSPECVWIIPLDQDTLQPSCLSSTPWIKWLDFVSGCPFLFGRTFYGIAVHRAYDWRLCWANFELPSSWEYGVTVTWSASADSESHPCEGKLTVEATLANGSKDCLERFIVKNPMNPATNTADWRLWDPLPKMRLDFDEVDEVGDRVLRVYARLFTLRKAWMWNAIKSRKW